MRELTAKDVTFVVYYEAGDIPVRGNVLASGDDAIDKAAEDEILARLDNGDATAWCVLWVTADWEGYLGRTSLGCCSFGPNDNMRDLEAFAYEDDMYADALADLNAVIARHKAKL